MKAAFPASSFTAAAARVQMGCAGSWAAPRAPRPRPFGGHDPGGASEKDDEGPRLGGGTRATMGWEGPREAAESGAGDAPTRRRGWHPGTAHRDRQGRPQLGEALRFELEPTGAGLGASLQAERLLSGPLCGRPGAAPGSRHVREASVSQQCCASRWGTRTRVPAHPRRPVLECLAELRQGVAASTPVLFGRVAFGGLKLPPAPQNGPQSHRQMRITDAMSPEALQ